MEPISYANGSTLDDPAIAYGIVFSNFMNKGVYTFQGGTDVLVKKMVAEAKRNGVDLRRQSLVEKVHIEKVGDQSRVTGIRVNGREIACRAVFSNANLKNTVMHLVGKEHLDPDFLKEAEDVRVNTSSCQVYIGIKKGESIPDIGDLVFTSDAETFSSDELTHIKTQSRTFSVYYPETRPHLKEPRYSIVASLNAKWDDWADLSEDEYQREKTDYARSLLYLSSDSSLISETRLIT